MKISIITACRNSESTIERAILSVTGQTYKSLEYIIIDGNSEDRSCEIIKKYSSHLHAFISEPDKNWADAMNKGLRLATGDFITYVNADDYLYDEHVVEDMVEVIRTHPDHLVYYGDTEIRPDPVFSSDTTIFKPPLPGDLLDNLILNIGPFMGATFYSRQVFDTVGVLETSFEYANDTEWFLRFFEHWDAKAFHYCPRTLFSYSMAGHSSRDVSVTLKAAFEFIDRAPVLQSGYWLARRTKKLQEKIIMLEKLYHQTQRLSMKRLADFNRLEKEMQKRTAQIDSRPAFFVSMTNKVCSSLRALFLRLLAAVSR